MRFNIAMFLERQKKVTYVTNVSRYEVYEAICYLIKNDSSNRSTASAIATILQNYIDFIPHKTIKNRNSIIETYTADLRKMPDNVANAILEKAKFVKEQKENKEKNIENNVLDLLKSEEIIK